MFLTIVKFNADKPEAEQGHRIVLALQPAELQAIIDGQAFALAGKQQFAHFEPANVEVMVMLETPELLATVNRDIAIHTDGQTVERGALSQPEKSASGEPLPDLTTVVPFGQRPS